MKQALLEGPGSGGCLGNRTRDGAGNEACPTTSPKTSPDQSLNGPGGRTSPLPRDRLNKESDLDNARAEIIRLLPP